MSEENKGVKVNFTSSLLEKGLDVAKDFLDKLIMPAVEETGLLLKDQVASWRLGNQVKILNRAKDICDKNNISPKAISLKLLCPYLEYASLEEDEYMQDKWAMLLANLVDSKQNTKNNIFPYILSQISKSELLILKEVYAPKMILKVKSREDLSEERNEIDGLFNKYCSSYLEQYNISSIDDLKGDTLLLFMNILLNDSKKNSEIDSVINYLDKMRSWHREISYEDKAVDRIKPFEAENLIRLGVLDKNLTGHVKANSFGRDVITQLDNLRRMEDLKVVIESEYSFRITELGELFLDLCLEKDPD